MKPSKKIQQLNDSTIENQEETFTKTLTQSLKMTLKKLKT